MPPAQNQTTESRIADSVQLIDRASSLFVSPTIERPDGSALVLASERLTEIEIPALNPVLRDHVVQAEELVENASFIAYLVAYASKTAFCRASLSQNRIDAVLDYHGRARTSDTDAAVPGRCTHTATLLCPFDVDYAKWRPILLGEKMLLQRDFIEFLQDMIHTVHAPPAAELLEVAEDLAIDRVVRFRSASNDRNGNVKFTYDEQDEGGGPHNGEYKLPEHVQLILPIFQGGNPQVLEPRLRYRMKDGILMLGLKLAGIETKEREAFRSIAEKVRADTKIDVYYTA